MLKQDEMTNAKSCLNKAEYNEMVFVLLARDAAAPYTIRMWAAERIKLGKNKWTDPQIIEALNCAVEMETQYRERNSAA